MAHLDLEQFDPNALTAQRTDRVRSLFHTQRMLIATLVASVGIVTAAAFVMTLLA